ncbi:MAG: pyridoxamine 5'-phosphate oxidase family protein, partial [Propionicimonas sp.]|nr:pyridoxamine 5'-phosphate oxidase family protein [Propionicimonas sp.]
METTGHNTPLSPDECRQLLRSQTVGRIGWSSRVGQVILPVSYVLRDDLLVFRTAVGSVLSDLVTPQQVCFEIDELDAET